MTTHGVAPFPLYWPLQYERTKYRKSAHFLVDFATARKDLLRELDLLFARDVLVSSNVPLRRDGLPGVPDREPEDPGVAVYFTRKAKGFVVACDNFSKVRWNLRAIGATIGALRTIERHGTTSMMEQAFSGFAALPPPSKDRDWREVLGVQPGTCDLDAVRHRYTQLARVHHPDVGGDSATMSDINAAFDRAMRELT